MVYLKRRGGTVNGLEISDDAVKCHGCDMVNVHRLSPQRGDLLVYRLSVGLSDVVRVPARSATLPPRERLFGAVWTHDASLSARLASRDGEPLHA